MTKNPTFLSTHHLLVWVGAWCPGPRVLVYWPTDTNPSLSSAFPSSNAPDAGRCQAAFGCGDPPPKPHRWNLQSPRIPQRAGRPVCWGPPGFPRCAPPFLLHCHCWWYCQVVMVRCYMMTDRQGWTDTPRKRDRKMKEGILEDMHKKMKESGQDRRAWEKQ